VPVWGVAVALLLLTTPPATAASRETKERTARKACLSGDYAKGMDILSDLFVETQDPIHIFNQGRCLEQNQQYKNAIARFQEFLRAGETHKLNPGDEAAAEKHIAACKGNLGTEPEVQATTALAPFTTPPQTRAPTPENTPVVETPAPSVAQPESPPRPAGTGAGLRVAGIVTAAVGIAAVGAGVGFNVLANNAIGDMESTLNGYAAKNSTHDTYVTLAWLGYGVGAACVVTGAVLYGIGLKAGRAKSADVALVPAVGQGQTGASLVGAF
jgi:hypothetical protein